MIPGLGRSPGGGHGNLPQYSCLENPHGQRSLVGYSPWGHKESDTPEQLSTHKLDWSWVTYPPVNSPPSPPLRGRGGEASCKCVFSHIRCLVCLNTCIGQERGHIITQYHPQPHGRLPPSLPNCLDLRS